MALRWADIALAPDAFAAVMATGIVSIAADDHHRRLISDALAALSVVGFAVLVVLAARVVFAGRTWDYRDPDVVLRLFTFVAAGAVLGARFSAHPAVLWALSAVVALSWSVLATLAVTDMSRRPWRELRDHAHGAWELASVATSGAAIVAAALTMSTGSGALFAIAVVAWVIAMIVYGLMTWLIVWRAAAGATFAPDHWILMGGLAIATLAGERVHAAAVAVGSGLAHWGRPVTVVTWVLASAWIPVLVCAHLAHLRRGADALRFSGAWWAAVFPLGMYSAATQAAAREMHWPALTTISLVFFWIALAAWLPVAFGGMRRLTVFVSRS
jgi:tellurite resistance protein TehA-like permease